MRIGSRYIMVSSINGMDCLVSQVKSRNQLHLNREIYPQHAFIHHEIANRIIHYIAQDFTPKSILNDGVFDPYFSDQLQHKYGVPVHDNLEGITHERFDLTVSNLYLQDRLDLEDRLRRYWEVTNPNGRIYLTMISIGSFLEARQAGGPLLNGFPDIEDLGDFIHALGFKDSVLFLEKINLTYERLETMLTDLRVVGGRPFDPYPGLKTPRWLDRWKESMNAHRDEKGHYKISFDVIYVEASIPVAKSTTKENNEVYFDINNIGKIE